MYELLTGKAFTYVILFMYAMRAGTYMASNHWGPASYWICALGITISAEFLIPRWP